MNRVLYKLALVPMKNYPFFLAQVLTFGYVAVYFTILFVRYQAGIVTREMLALPKSRFMLIGLLEAMGVASGMAAAAMLPGPSIPVLSQVSLVLCLRPGYRNLTHWVGPLLLAFLPHSLFLLDLQLQPASPRSRTAPFFCRFSDGARRKQKPETQGPALAPPLLECALSKNVDLTPVLPWTADESNEHGRTLIWPSATAKRPASKAGVASPGVQKKKAGVKPKATPDAPPAVPNTSEPTDEEGEARGATSLALVAEPPEAS
ncbi:protein CLT2, chloroplastic-like [Hordeum vulgare]|nr:protein CLT2, chloroplastic-like [Hordeum vulgare]